MSKKNRNRKRRRAAGLAPVNQQAGDTTVMGPTPKAVTPPARCNFHQPVAVMEANEGRMVLFAGGKGRLMDMIDRGQIVPRVGINLSGMAVDFVREFPVSGNVDAEAMFPAALMHGPANDVAVIEIAWDDGGVPIGLSKDWWQLMADTLMTIDGDVAVCCVGGHGRTGTFLAIVMALTGKVPLGGDPVKAMRDAYCDTAVETQSQVNYIERITGMLVSEAPSDHHRHKAAVKVVGGTGWTNPNVTGAASSAIATFPDHASTSAVMGAQSYDETLVADAREPNGWSPSGDFVMDGVHYVDEAEFNLYEDMIHGREVEHAKG